MDKFNMPPVGKKAPTEEAIGKVVMDSISKYQSTYGLNLSSQEVNAIVNDMAKDVSRAFAYYARQFDISPKEVRNMVNQLLDGWDKSGKPPQNVFAEVRERIRQVQPEEFREYQAAASESARKTGAEIAKRMKEEKITEPEARLRIAYDEMHRKRLEEMPRIYRSAEDVYGPETKIAKNERPERLEHPSQSLIIPERKGEMTPREERAARRAEEKREHQAAEAQARAQARAEREQREAQRKAGAAAGSAAGERKGKTPSNKELADELAKSAMKEISIGLGNADETTRKVLAGGTKPSAASVLSFEGPKKAKPAQPGLKPAEGEVAEMPRQRMKAGDVNVSAGEVEERQVRYTRKERAEPGVAEITAEGAYRAALGAGQALELLNKGRLVKDRVQDQVNILNSFLGQYGKMDKDERERLDALVKYTSREIIIYKSASEIANAARAYLEKTGA